MKKEIKQMTAREISLMGQKKYKQVVNAEQLATIRQPAKGKKVMNKATGGRMY